MHKVRDLSIFVLFMEEFVLWSPHSINTLIELLTLIILRSSEQMLYMALTQYINPGFCAILFLMSIGTVCSFIKSVLFNYSNPTWILWISRHSVIRYALSVGVFGIMIYRILQFLKAGDVDILDLYQSKLLWTIIFAGIALVRFFAADETTTK